MRPGPDVTVSDRRGGLLIGFGYHLLIFNFMSDMMNFSINHLQKEFVQVSSNCIKLDE